MAPSMFPLPLGMCEAPSAAHLSRGVRQRVSRRRSYQDVVNDCLKSLIWMAGCEEDNAPKQPSPVQLDVHRRVELAVRQRGPPTEAPSEEDAARALLGGRFQYEHTTMHVSPYDRSRVSLPDKLGNAPFADELGDEGTRALLQGCVSATCGRTRSGRSWSRPEASQSLTWVGGWRPAGRFASVSSRI